jgi:hypothetical protein
MVPHSVTARIQESHLFLLHALMDRIEAAGVNTAIADQPRIN